MQSAARNMARTSRHRSKPCQIPGLPRGARFAERRETIFHPRSFGANSRTSLAPNRYGRWCTDGRNEAGDCTRAGGVGGEDARADANEIDSGHCRRNHCGRSISPRSGHQPTVSQTQGGGERKHQFGEDDSRPSGPTVVGSRD